MAGVPPFFGFVARGRPEAFHAVPVTLALLVAGSALTVAHSARFLWAASPTSRRAPVAVESPPPPCLLPPAVLAVAGLLLGPLAGPVAACSPVRGSSATVTTSWPSGTVSPGARSDLALALVAGGLLFALRDRLPSVLAWLRGPDSALAAYEWVTRKSRPARDRGHRSDPARVPATVPHHPGRPGRLPGSARAARRHRRRGSGLGQPVQVVVCL
jgi:multicomponent Na+:H+ antiporter subunit A